MSKRPAAVVALLALLGTGCATKIPGTSSGVGAVVAAESSWGSIAAQLAGDRATVTSIVNNPGADPHDYEPRAADARLVASAGVVIVNGAGYDGWADRLLDANASKSRDVVHVGKLAGVGKGGNPHQWYSPSSVYRVIDEIVAIYKRRDPADAGYFDEQRSRYLSAGLREYGDLIARIKATYAGTPVGASESMFAPMAPALGLRLLTPASFLKAISEGTDPTVADKATIDRQIAERAIKVYVYNSQNATPDVRSQVEACREHGIPVTTITETLVPADATFQGWQAAQLRDLEAALAKGTGP